MLNKQEISEYQTVLSSMVNGDIPFDADMITALQQKIEPMKPWIPEHKPLPKQKEFLNLKCEEALYGGSAGGGKSDALLMYALEGVHVRGYRCLILRKTFAELNKQGALIPRSKEWLNGSGAKWKTDDKTWTFPSGAVIQFGHLKDSDSYLHYLSTEWTRICFDELTTFREVEYTYLFSRLRSPIGFPITSGVRGASNPGGPGHNWVKKRFISDEAQETLLKGESGVFWKKDKQTDRKVAFVPARLEDNPFIDYDEYAGRLSMLPPVTRERLLRGDWSIKEDSVFRPDWLRYYEYDGVKIMGFRPDGKRLPGILYRDCEIFQTCDTAGTSKERELVRSGKKEASFSCIATWAYSKHNKHLFLINIWRDKVDYVPLKEAFYEQFFTYKPRYVHIEKAHLGPAIYADLKNAGIPVKYLSTFVKKEKSDTGKPGKLIRSTALQNMMQDGRMFVPMHNTTWLPEYESEIMGWEGTDKEQADQIDVSSYAARLVDGIGSKGSIASQAFIKEYMQSRARKTTSPISMSMFNK